MSSSAPDEVVKEVVPDEQPVEQVDQVYQVDEQPQEQVDQVEEQQDQDPEVDEEVVKGLSDFISSVEEELDSSLLKEPSERSDVKSGDKVGGFPNKKNVFFTIEEEEEKDYSQSPIFSDTYFKQFFKQYPSQPPRPQPQQQPRPQPQPQQQPRPQPRPPLRNPVFSMNTHVVPPSRGFGKPRI